mgnify:CR=1 FL=1
MATKKKQSVIGEKEIDFLTKYLNNPSKTG